MIFSMHCLPVLHAILQALDSGDNILHATPLLSAQNSTQCRYALLRSNYLVPAAVFFLVFLLCSVLAPEAVSTKLQG